MKELLNVHKTVLHSLWCCFFISGKVHGSLARAGKVKGQTPKVTWSSNLLLRLVNIFLQRNLQVGIFRENGKNILQIIILFGNKQL